MKNKKEPTKKKVFCFKINKIKEIFIDSSKNIDFTLFFRKDGNGKKE